MGKKTKKWIKPRHKVLQAIAKFVMRFYITRKYGVEISKCDEKRQRIILSNHQTAFDQFFIAYGFPAPVYYLASEDIFSNGLVSKLLKFAANPIPIKKQVTDARAVINCLKVVKEGGTLAIFPEGNRTYSGTTEHILFSIVKLVKATKLPLTFFRIEGGYGVQPRWSDKVRRGKMRAYSSKTVEPEEYLAMTDEQLYGLIKSELYVDERKTEDVYRSDALAEYLERAVYVCPYCGLAEFRSEKNVVRCLSCGREIEYLPDKRLKGVGFDFPFPYVKEWYDYQNEFVNGLNVEDYFDKPLFTDEVSVFSVELYKKKRRIEKKTELICYGDKLYLGDRRLNFSDIAALSVLGRNKLNIYFKDGVYQIKGEKSYNAVKYVNIYYRYKNQNKGEADGKFLGL